jgi:hypothetical protein
MTDMITTVFTSVLFRRGSLAIGLTRAFDMPSTNGGLAAKNLRSSFAALCQGIIE